MGKATSIKRLRHITQFMKHIIFMNGTVGSGKSFVASQLQKHGFTRVLIDTIYHSVPRTKPNVHIFQDIPFLKKTWKMAEKEILSKARKQPVIFESTGINQPWWNNLYKACKKKHGKNVKIVHVYIPLSLAWKRMKLRNNREHGPRVYTYSRMKKIHHMVCQTTWKPDFKIINKEKNKTQKQIKLLLEQLRQE